MVWSLNIDARVSLLYIVGLLEMVESLTLLVYLYQNPG